jgi:hypothetical protein
MIKNLFKKQIELGNPITGEILEKLNSKKYYNGEDILIGDVVLLSFLYELEESNLNWGDGGESKMEFKIIKLKEEHLENFEYDIRFQSGDDVPVIKLKK